MDMSRSVRRILPLVCLYGLFSFSASAAEPDAAARSAVRDVSLSADHSLVGQILDADGKPIDGASVVLQLGDEVIAAVTSDQNGLYRFEHLHTGLYHVIAGNHTTAVRVWSSQSAPPSARSYAIVVIPTGVVRGQFGALGALGGVSAGTAAAVAGGVAVIATGTFVVMEMQDKSATMPPVSP